MWHLSQPDEVTKEQYVSSLRFKLYDSIDSYEGSKKDSLKKVLIPNNSYDIIDKLLIYEPEAAHALNNELMKKLLKCEKKVYNEKDLIEYQRIKRMKSPKNPSERKVYNTYSDLLKRLWKVFKYDSWISGNSDFAYWLSKAKGVRTCTYCGREYIYTVENLTPKDEIRHIARPDYDHYLSQELYPLLSLNYFNLIPCCPICNRTVKGTKVINLIDFVHPYLSLDEPKFKFSFRFDDYSKIHGEVTIINDFDIKEKNTLDLFQLRAFYKKHSATELDDLLRLTQRNGKQYLENYLVKIMSGLKIGKADAYRSMFGGELYGSEKMERPLSKFKRDILEELGVLDYFKSEFE